MSELRSITPNVLAISGRACLAGMAAAANTTADVLVDGYTYGSLSMTTYTLGCTHLEGRADTGGAAPITSTAPPESANV